MSSRIEFCKDGYMEDLGYITRNEMEPNARSQEFIYYHNASKWHAKISYRGYLGGEQKNKAERREELRELTMALHFPTLSLLRDTVTSIDISEEQEGESLPMTPDYAFPAANRFVHLLGILKHTAREDGNRVHFPPFSRQVFTRTDHVSVIASKQRISGQVSKVCLGDEVPMIYKQLERDLYSPLDTISFEEELEHLKIFVGTPRIAQLISVIYSDNPYQTVRGERNRPAIRGMLLKYYPGGTLEEAIPRLAEEAHPWRKWPVQMADAISHLHRQTITHMNIKPHHFVIDENGELVLIDISGLRSYTLEWLAPELRNQEDPFNQCLDSRRLSDIWAYGRILNAMADALDDCWEKTLLKQVVGECSYERPNLRKPFHVLTQLLAPLWNAEAPSTA